MPEFLNRKGSQILSPTKKVWDVILSFRNEILDNPNILLKTKDNHLCNLWQIISRNPQIIEQDTEAFIEEEGKVFLDTIKASSWSSKTCQLRSDYVKHLIRHAKSVSKLNYAHPIPKAGDQVDLDAVKKMLSNSQSLIEIRNLPFEKVCRFFEHLYKINERDYLIAKLIWITKKTLESILDIRIKDFVDYIFLDIDILIDIRPYLYKILSDVIQKDNCKLKSIRIAPPSGLPSVIGELINDHPFIADMLVFQTRTGKPVLYTQPLRSMRTASESAEIGFTITPKLLSIYAANQDSYSQDAIDQFLLAGYCERMIESELEFRGLASKDVKHATGIIKEVMKFVCFHMTNRKSKKSEQTQKKE